MYIYVDFPKNEKIRLCIIKFQYDPKVIEFLKIHQARWHPQKSIWIHRDLKEFPDVLKSAFPERVVFSLEALLWKSMRSFLMRNYSRRTTINYAGQIFLFFKWAVPPNQRSDPFAYRNVEDAKISQYLEYCHFDKKLKSSSIRASIQSLKFFWRECLLKPFPATIKYPKKEIALPDVLTKEEVLRLAESRPNIKHKLLILFSYSTGMRLSEIVSLRTSDIDFKREVIHIRQAKGKKDRIVPLSKKIAALYQEYQETSKSDSSIYVFPGQYHNTHISPRTAEKIFEHARNATKIHKKISFHSLRHAFATHLLESGTGIRHIQKLLGHSSVRTTERYAQISKTEIQKIPSPLDLE